MLPSLCLPFVRHNADITCSDRLCPRNIHRIYQQPPDTPGLYGVGLAGHSGDQRSLVQVECARECPG